MQRSIQALQLIQKETTFDSLIGYQFTIEDKEEYISGMEDKREESIK